MTLDCFKLDYSKLDYSRAMTYTILLVGLIDDRPKAF